MCFNPCSNGSCSPRVFVLRLILFSLSVLILVLMEVAHREELIVELIMSGTGFNPCSNGSCSPSTASGSGLIWSIEF